MGGSVIVVRSGSEWNSKLAESSSFGGKALVVDFSATWCGPCKAISPIFEQLSTQYPNVTFIKIDVDEVPDVAQACGVSAMPTFQGYFNGQQVAEVVGADPRKLQELIATLNAKATPAGPGQKLGGGQGSSDAPSGADGMRAKLAAAAEARLARLGGGGS